LLTVPVEVDPEDEVVLVVVDVDFLTDDVDVDDLTGDVDVDDLTEDVDDDAAAADDDDDELPDPVESVPVYVLLMGPHLMLEKVTEAPGEFASTSAGTPEFAEQVPRVTPGALADLVDGYGASSQRMSAV